MAYATDELLPAEHRQFCIEWHDGQWSELYKAQCNNCILDAEHAEGVKLEVRRIQRDCLKKNHHWPEEAKKAADFLAWLEQHFPEPNED